MSTRITRDEYDENNAPKNEDGEDYRLIIVGPEEIVFGDGYEELVAALIDDEDYLGATVEQKLAIRHDLAVSLATQIQAGVVLSLNESGTLDPEALTEPEINLLLNSKDAPYEADGEWSAKDTSGAIIPLFLVTTHYAPFTETPRVVGEDVVYIDPTDEEKLIRTLSALEVIELYEIAG